MFESIDSISIYLSLYTSLTTFSLIIVSLRVLKMLHFQPRMGLITRTLEEASTNLLHFSFMAMLIFVGCGISVATLAACCSTRSAALAVP